MNKKSESVERTVISVSLSVNDKQKLKPELFMTS